MVDIQKDIRWRQRFANFEKAYFQLKIATELTTFDVIQRAGLIQLFEITFELAWKVLKDYQEAQGFKLQSPRDVIKQAYQSELIDNGHVWIDALEDRNLTVHTYDERIAEKVKNSILKVYFSEIQELYNVFKIRL